MARVIEREDESRLVERFTEGESVPHLAQAYGTTEQIVRDALFRASDRMTKPTDQHRPDVPIENEVELIDRFVEGESVSDLALAYHTREQQVRNALVRVSERMLGSTEALNGTSTNEDIERANAQNRYINRFADLLEADNAQMFAKADLLNRFADRLLEENDRLEEKGERAGGAIAFLVIAVVIGLGIFALTTI